MIVTAAGSRPGVWSAVVVDLHVDQFKVRRRRVPEPTLNSLTRCVLNFTVLKANVMRARLDGNSASIDDQTIEDHISNVRSREVDTVAVRSTQYDRLGLVSRDAWSVRPRRAGRNGLIVAVDRFAVRPASDVHRVTCADNAETASYGAKRLRLRARIRVVAIRCDVVGRGTGDICIQNARAEDRESHRG